MPPTTYTTTVSTFDRTPEQRRRELEDLRMRRQPRAHWDPDYYADPRNAWAARSILGPEYGSQMLTEAQWGRRYIAAQASMFGPAAERAIHDVLDASPTVSPGTAAALAQFAETTALPDNVKDELLILDAEARTLDASATAGRNADTRSEGEKGGMLSNILGEITRPVFALASMPFEVVIGSIRSTIGNLAGGEEYQQGLGELGEVFGQSLGGQYLRGLFTSESADLGEGYIPRGEVHARQIQATRSAAPLVHGHAWTLGRGIGSMIFDDPDSLAYRNLSGVIDLIANISLDPLVFAGKAAQIGRGIRAGAAVAERVSIGRQVTTALDEQKAHATLQAANETVRAATTSFAKSQRAAAERMARLDEQIDIDARLDRVLDSEDLVRAEMAAPPRPPTDLGAAVQGATARAGDEGVDALTASVTTKAPELPGVFTDAIPTAGTERVLPASDNGVDALVAFDDVAPEVPVLRSVDDPVDNPAALAASITSTVGRSPERTRAISAMAAELGRPGVTYGDVMAIAADKGVGAPLLSALRESEVDGITDAFRLTEGEGGVWWTSRDHITARWSPEGWQTDDLSPSALSARMDTLAQQRKDLKAEAARARRKKAALQQRQAQAADTFAKAADARTSTWDSYDAVHNAVEYGYGVRRDINGRPQISYDLLKEALFGPARGFDEAIQAGENVPAWLKAATAANRAMVGTMTLGVSEAARLARARLVQPFTARTSQAVLDFMVRADESPTTLGMLQRLTNNKVSPQLLMAVQRAKNEEEVLEVLGPALGLGITRPIGPNILGAQRLRVNEIGTGRAVDRIFRKAERWMVDTAERAGTVAPRFGVHVNLADPQGSSARLRNYLDNLPGMQLETKDRLIGTFLAKGTEVGRAEQIRRIMDEVADELTVKNDDLSFLGKRINPNTAFALRDSLKNATAIYAGGRSKANNWWLDTYAADAKVGFVAGDGQLIHLTGPQLEAELARGGMVLPNMGELRDAVGRWGWAVQTVPGLKGARNFLDAGMDYWRSSVLFRYAYTVRNIAEMQFRMFLTGHRSIFNDPAGALALASGMQRKSMVSRGFFARMARYNKTADGKSLGIEAVEDLDSADNVVGEFADMMNRTMSHHDMRTMRAMEQHHGVTEVAWDQPGFIPGWADQLIALRHSKLARLVAGQNTPEIEAALARGVDRKDAVVDWLLTSQTGTARRIRNEYAEAGVDYARIFSDPVALKSYLFDSEASVNARIMQYTAGGDENLVRFLATGELWKEGDLVFTMASRGVDPDTMRVKIVNRNRNLATQLRHWHELMPEDYRLKLRVFTGKKTERNVANRMFDSFFAWNAKKENAWAMGPEFAYAFNDASVNLMRAMKMDDRQRMLEFIQKAEGRFRPHSEILIKARQAMKAPDGSLTLADVEKVAGVQASQHVKGLFYDALDRKQIFHQLRLVMPFAQPFVDTLWRWGRLAAARPYMMEKLGRVSIGLTEPGSGVIYDDFDYIDPFSDRQSRDPTQGFIFKNEYGEESFAFPLIGSVLGQVMSPVAGFNVANSMQLTAPVANLNLAFQGDVDYLPGVGPIISFPLSQLMPDDAYGAIPEWLRDYVFPYGEPSPETGIIESTFLPSWARRLTGALWNEEFRSYSYKGMLAYMASTGEYPGLAGDPQVRQKLIDDVQGGARILTFIRAIGAAILPAAPTQEIYAADKDGRLIGSAYLGAHFRHLQEENDYDFEASTAQFIDAYGMQALAAIVPSSEGDLAITGPAWDFLRKHEGANAYSDVLAAFFPGDYSIEAQKFQEETHSREKLSVEERVEKMISFMYGAEKTAIESRSARDEWNIDETDNAIEDLQHRYGGVIPTFSGEDAGTKLDKIRNALDTFEDLRETRGGQGAILLFEAFEQYDDAAQDEFGSGLSSRKAVRYREAFLEELDQIASEFGGYDKAAGSVDSIARYFIKDVTPRS
jgi:hypothetical protein